MVFKENKAGKRESETLSVLIKCKCNELVELARDENKVTLDKG